VAVVAPVGHSPCRFKRRTFQALAGGDREELAAVLYAHLSLLPLLVIFSPG
jgi:hypothetical protein